ncbi:hypothetical protein M9H77_05013 [Catharanthus roseus]|uniref:Uncharacterized protein n=1 Tax=Catharanthus roseus TaxID=4058 RepID=A0ACC0CFV2_CATRO|nr:hypothetical protein M9H77_05013 [Catharanthus roseus]
MVRPSGRKEGDDLGPVTDRTGQVEGRTVTASSRAVRGRHSTSDLPATPTYLALDFHHGTGKLKSSAQPPVIPFRSRPPLQPHQSHNPVPYEPYGYAKPSSHPTDIVYDSYLHAPTIRPRISYRFATQEPILEFIDQPRQIEDEFFDKMFDAAPQDSSCSTHGYFHAEYGVSSSVPYVPSPADRGEADERGDDGDGDGDGDGGDDNQDEGDDAGDEEQPVPVAPVAHVSGSDGRPRHGKGKWLTCSFMSVMIPALTHKRKKVKPSDWEQTEPAEGGPIDPELIPSYGRHIAGRIWRGQLILGVPAYGSVVDSRLSREQLLQLVQDDLGLALTDGLEFNVAELHAVATCRQTSLSPRVSAACYLQYILGSSLFSDRVATLFLPDYGHCCRMQVLLGGVDIAALSDVCTTS